MMSGRSAVQAACWFALGVATWASPVGGWAEVVSPTRDSEVVEVLPSGGRGRGWSVSRAAGLIYAEADNKLS